MIIKEEQSSLHNAAINTDKKLIKFGRVLKPFFTKILIYDNKFYFKLFFFCRLIWQWTRICLEFFNQCVAVATSHVTGRKKETQNVFTFSWPFWLKLLLTNF